MENIEWFIIRYRNQLLGTVILIVALTVIVTLTMGLIPDRKSCDQHWSTYRESKRGGGPGISQIFIPSECQKQPE